MTKSFMPSPGSTEEMRRKEKEEEENRITHDKALSSNTLKEDIHLLMKWKAKEENKSRWGSRKRLVQIPEPGGVITSIFSIKWRNTRVITRQNFHDDWFKVNESLQELVDEKCMVNPFQSDKALLVMMIQQLLFFAQIKIGSRWVLLL